MKRRIIAVRTPQPWRLDSCNAVSGKGGAVQLALM
jgi:hypothetical protein